MCRIEKDDVDRQTSIQGGTLNFFKLISIAMKIKKEIDKAAKDKKITAREAWYILELLLSELKIDILDRHLIKL